MKISSATTFLIANTLIFTSSNAVCEIEASPEACASMFPDGIIPQSPTLDSTQICRRTSSRSYFMTSFGNDIKSPDFSAYKVTRDEALTLTSDRPWSWRKDPDVDENSQVKHYARSSGATSGSPCWGTNAGNRDFSWDRGHLAPNKIMSAHPAECEGQWQTFYITNAAMQYDDMNRGSWESLESHVYEWLEEKSASVNANEIYIVSGAVYAGRQNSGDLRCDLDTGLNFDRTSSSTTNFMAVPSHFFKILCDPQNQESIAYLDENVQDGNLFGMSVRNLEEKFLNYDLFPEGACNTYNYSISHWDHGNWEDRTESLNMQYLEPYAKPDDSLAWWPGPEWTLFAAGGGVGVVLLIILTLILCRCDCCCSCCKGSAQDKKSRPKSAYGYGDFEMSRGDDLL